MPRANQAQKGPSKTGQWSGRQLPSACEGATIPLFGGAILALFGWPIGWAALEGTSNFVWFTSFSRASGNIQVKLKSKLRRACIRTMIYMQKYVTKLRLEFIWNNLRLFILDKCCLAIWQDFEQCIKEKNSSVSWVHDNKFTYFVLCAFGLEECFNQYTFLYYNININIVKGRAISCVLRNFQIAR